MLYKCPVLFKIRRLPDIIMNSSKIFKFIRYQPWNTREKQKVFDVPGVRVDVSFTKDIL